MTWALFSSMKSGKREAALSLLMFWAFITGYLYFWIDPDVFGKYENGWETLTWATLAFAAGAFGIDFVMKSKAAIGGGAPSPLPATRRRKSDSAEQHTGAV